MDNTINKKMRGFEHQMISDMKKFDLYLSNRWLYRDILSYWLEQHSILSEESQITSNKRAHAIQISSILNKKQSRFIAQCEEIDCWFQDRLMSNNSSGFILFYISNLLNSILIIKKQKMFKAQNYYKINQDKSLSRQDQRHALPSIYNSRHLSPYQDHIPFEKCDSKSNNKNKGKLDQYQELIQLKLTKPFKKSQNSHMRKMPWLAKPIDLNKQTIKLQRMKISTYKNKDQSRQIRFSFPSRELSMSKTKRVQGIENIGFDSRIQTIRLVKAMSSRVGDENKERRKRSQCKIALKRIFPLRSKQNQLDRLRQQFEDERLSTIPKEEYNGQNGSQFMSIQSLTRLIF